MTQALEGTLKLGLAHIALPGQPGTDIAFGTNSRSDQNTLTGSVRSYANGSTRVIAGTSNTRVESLTMVGVTQAQKDAFESMLGKTCLFRDTYGRKLYVVFLTWTEVDIPLSGLVSIQTTFNVVTYSEVV